MISSSTYFKSKVTQMGRSLTQFENTKNWSRFSTMNNRLSHLKKKGLNVWKENCSLQLEETKTSFEGTMKRPRSSETKDILYRNGIGFSRLGVVCMVL